jgi:hypothetical protein
VADAKFVNKDKILARFAKMPAIIQATVEESGKGQIDQLVAALRRAAPVSELEGHPGELRESISAAPTPGRIASWRIVAWARDAQGRLYGRFVEFGHTTRGGKFVHASPFWFSTYRAWKPGMLRKVKADVRAAIRANFPQ